MKNFKKIICTLCIMVILILSSTQSISAKTQEIESLHLKMEIPEDVIVLTDKLSSADPVWAQAGILDVKKQKDDYEKMGVAASLYKSATSTYINIMSKTSEKSHDIYNLSELSEEEVNSFIESLTQTDDKTAVFKTDRYEHSQVPFYRLEINATQNGLRVKELIYGTIVNGISYTFDIYNGSGTTIDEEFLKQIVDSVSFTKITPKAEGYAAEAKAVRNLQITGIVVLILIVALIIFLRYRSKKKAKEKEELSKRFEEFKKQLRENPDKLRTQPKFINHIDYNPDVLKDFIIYDRYKRNIPMFVVSGVAVLLLAYYFTKSSNSLVSLLILVIVIGVYIYTQVTTTEKQIEIFKKRYDSPEHNTIQFYDKFFTVRHIGSIIEYPYFQIEQVREYNDYIYLYVGTGLAVYMNKNGFDQGSSEEFLTFIKDKKKNS